MCCSYLVVLLPSPLPPPRGLACILPTTTRYSSLSQGFFPRDGYLIEKANIDKIRHIPTVIVQGRYDMVCPAVSAFDLKKAFPEADLHITLTGHSSFEKEIIEKLVAATDAFRLRK